MGLKEEDKAGRSGGEEASLEDCDPPVLHERGS
jgi:hypothetical protein